MNSSHALAVGGTGSATGTARLSGRGAQLLDLATPQPVGQAPAVAGAAAGPSDTLCSDDAIALIHQVGRGIPRAVNNLAVQSLVAAFATGKAIVDESSARAAVTEVTTE